MKRKKLNINRLLRRLRGNRKHKDRLFQKVFERKEDLLALYNAVQDFMRFYLESKTQIHTEPLA